MVTPAHHTKGAASLTHAFGQFTFVLNQSDDSRANGTSLWLGGQAMALYFASELKRPTPGTTALELGSGIGLTALAVATLGYRVLATDIQLVYDTVLAKNIASNVHSISEPATVISSVVDWTEPLPDALLDPPPSLLFTSDTIYATQLVTPLLRTLHAASLPARAPCYVCLERRDPALVDAALNEARQVWGFTVSRVPHKKLVQALRRGGVTDEALAAGDWDDLEIWKLTHPRQTVHAVLPSTDV